MKRGYTKARVILFNVPSTAHGVCPRSVHSRRRFSPNLCAVLLLLFMIAFCLVIYVFHSYNHESVLHWTPWERLRPSAVQSEDGLKVTWYSDLNTRERLKMALTIIRNDLVMLEADVSPRSPDVREQLMMSLGGDVNSDLSLEDWLDTVIEARRAGIKLNFMAAGSLERALQILKARSHDLRHVPVWLTVNVVTGPGGDGKLADVNRVTRLVNSIYPWAQLVFSWSMSCCGDEGVKFGRGSMESMLKVCQKTQQPIIVSAPATGVASQWRHFRWLLERSDRLSLLLWSPEVDKSWKNDTSYYDLLTVRNDWDKKRIFYNLPETKLQHFRQLAATAGSLLHHFDMPDRDAARVTWFHGANTKDRLARAGREGAMVVEGDVSLEGHTTVPVMAHPSTVRVNGVLLAGRSNHTLTLTLTLAKWLDLVLTTNKAIKLDIKTPEAVVPALKVLAEKRSQLQRPIWLSADIFSGPKGVHDPMNTTHFLKSVNSIFPEATFSLGWTSGPVDGPGNDTYSWEMVERMEKVAQKLKQPVTFGVRAIFARKSWDRFDWLLRQSRKYTVTLWTALISKDEVAKSDLDFIRHQSERSRVFFDVGLPPDAMSTL